MRTLIQAVVFSAVAPGVVMMPAHAQGDLRPRDSLFTVDRPLEVTLRADWEAVFRNRDPDREVKVPGSLVVVNGAGMDTIPVSYHTRGNYRLRRSTCSVPPVMVVFDQGGKAGTPFAGQRELKLVTHCRDNEHFEQSCLVEYLTYRMYNVITDRSFGARHLVATWEDTVRASRSVKPAFIIEDDRMVASRLGGRLDKAPISFAESDPVTTANMALFLLLIGNTDWSQPAQHNVKLVRTDLDHTFYPVPYDFDWSGVIDAPYAKPDPRLGIRSVRDRLYRGPCVSEDIFQSALGNLLAKRDTILGLVEGFEGLNENRKKKVMNYLSGFFKDVSDYPSLKWKFLGRCG